MSGYYEPLSAEEDAQVTKLAESNLRHAAYRPHEIGYSRDDLYDDVFSDTLEDVDGGDLWHLPAFQVSDVCADVVNEWETKVSLGEAERPDWMDA